MRLVQLLGDEIEELWQFPDWITDEQIKNFWKNYRDTDYDSFEEFMDDLNEITCTRVFVDEIYV